METTGRRYYLLVENDLNDPRFIDPLVEKGYGMDAQWMDEFHHALRVSAGEEQTGYYADFDGVGHLTKSYRDGYVYDGQFSTVRQGRQDGFVDLHNGSEVPDPQVEHTFEQSKLQWELREQEPHQTLFQYYQTLIALRKQEPALHHLSR